MKTTLLVVASPVVAALAFAILPPASAHEVRCFTSGSAATAVAVPSGGGPCPKIASSHADCLKVLRDRGWDGSTSYFACATQGYKN